MNYGEGIELAENQIFGEYFCEREGTDLKRLQIPLDNHENVGIRPCHDMYVDVDYKGILTMVRDRKPAFGERWPIGGAIYRGFSTRDSIEKAVERECGLHTVGTAIMLGSARLVSNYSRNDLAAGLDSTAWVFYVKGEGELNLDEDHKNPMFTKSEDLTNDFLDSLHPYVKDFLPKAVEISARKVA